MTGEGGSLLLGVDVGTTHVKGALVSSAGTVMHVARRPTPLRALAAGQYAHPPGELIALVCEVLRECVLIAGDRRIAGIGIASMSEAGVLLDRRWQPIGEIIPWFDDRSAPEALLIESEVGAERLFAATGLRAHGKYSLAKLLWLTRHRAAAARRARSWAGVAELAGHALTGRLATNGSLACRTQAFDVVTRRWSPDLLSIAGFSPDRMPEVAPFGQSIGGLLPERARDLGLPVGLPIGIAGHDHVVGAVGAGVVEPGQALDSIGSAEACLIVTPRPAPNDRLRKAGFSVGCHPIDGKGYVLAGLQSSGSLVEWFIDSFMSLPKGEDRYASFIRLLGEGERAGPGATAGGAEAAAMVSAAPAGPGEIVVLPYLRGRTAPSPDPAARLAILGLRETHRLPDLARALIDGLACAAAWTFEELEAVARLKTASIRLIGGGARNERWVEAKAALASGRVERVETDEATALGAALVGGLAGGIFGSIGEAVRSASPATTVPRPASAAAYRRFFEWSFLPAARGSAPGRGRPRSKA